MLHLDVEFYSEQRYRKDGIPGFRRNHKTLFQNQITSKSITLNKTLNDLETNGFLLNEFDFIHYALFAQQNDEIKIRSKHNLVQGRSLMEMLESSIKRYQNNLITSAEIIQEFINLAKEIKETDKRGDKIKMSKDELAFYDAVAANDSAKQLLGDEVLIKLARELVIKVKESATIDWTVKESVNQGMKVAVKRLLRVYGYPPDLQKLAADTVLSQAEMLAEFWN
jgi:type I site-specific restriction-modification system R (restriction) subunit